MNDVEKNAIARVKRSHHFQDLFAQIIEIRRVERHIAPARLQRIADFAGARHRNPFGSGLRDQFVPARRNVNRALDINGATRLDLTRQQLEVKSRMALANAR